MTSYAVGLARPDRWAWGRPAESTCPWHAVEAHRPAGELDGEMELAVCGAIVHVEGAQQWEAPGAGRRACADCRRLTGAGVSAGRIAVR